METLFRTHANPCEIFGGKSETWTGFSPNPSSFPCQYDSSNTPYIIFIYMSLLLGQMDASGEPSKKQCFFGKGRATDTKLLLRCLQQVQM